MKALAAADPRQVGPYRILAELGRGGMGRVLLGAGQDGRLVAVKLVRERFAADAGFRERFRREVEASRMVSGAYTAAVVDADPEAPWLASVFVPGPSLRTAVKETGPLPEAAVLRLAAGLASALVEIHRAGLVHRDLKPGNVLLTGDGPRVIDFGVAGAAESEGAGDWLVGTPGFMSPEQANGLPPTTASDVFSLGSVLVLASTGRAPFDGPGTPQTLYNVAHATPDLSALPPSVRRVVSPCLAKDPASRPAPAGILASLAGSVPPSALPWPPRVHELIAAQEAEVARLLDPPPVAGGRFLVGLGALLAVGALVGTLVWAPWHSGSRAVASPLRSSSPSPVATLAGIALRGHNGYVNGVAFSPDGAALATAGEDNTVRLWDVAGRRETGSPLRLTGRAKAVAYTPSGSAVVSADSDGVIRLTDAASGTPKSTLRSDAGPIESMALSPDGHTLATGTMDGTVELWDLTASRRTAVIDGRAGYVEALAFSPDGHTLAVGTTGTVTNADTANTEGIVELWDLTAGRQIGRAMTGYVAWMTQVAFSPDGRTLAAGDEYTIRLWDPTTQTQRGQPIDCRPENCRAFAYAPSGQTLATGGLDGVVRLWDTTTHQRTGRSLTGPTGVIEAVAFSPQGTTLAAASADNVAYLWPVPAR